jgi:hypothetical protein
MIYGFDWGIMEDERVKEDGIRRGSYLKRASGGANEETFSGSVVGGGW